MMAVFVAVLLADSIALIMTVLAAVRRPRSNYTLIAAVAFCATGLAFHQVVTGRGDALAVVFTAVLVVMMMWRIAGNFRSAPPRRRR